MIALLLFYFDIIATFSAVQGRSITGCSPDEVLNNCGNLCELTCEMVTGIPRPCSPACGCPACVCKENTYRLNGSCVPMEVCEKYVQDGSSEGSATVDWQGDRTIPPGTITPIPCDEFPCPTGFYCSEGQEQCFVPGDCIVTPTECVPDGQTRPSEGSTTPPGTATDCVSHPCPDGFVCSDGEVVCSGYDDCTTGPPQCTPVDTDATAGPGTTPSTSCSTYTCNPDEVCTMAVGTPKCIPANMTCGENEEVNPCGDLCDLLCADLTGIPRACPLNVCNKPACVCKTGFFRLNQTCVTSAQCW